MERFRDTREYAVPRLTFTPCEAGRSIEWRGTGSSASRTDAAQLAQGVWYDGEFRPTRVVRIKRIVEHENHD